MHKALKSVAIEALAGHEPGGLKNERKNALIVRPAWYRHFSVKPGLMSSPMRNDENEPFRNDKEWKPFFAMIDEKYKTKTMTLPTGTVLYHGTLSANGAVDSLNASTESHDVNVVYFGLDFAISAWMLTEHWKNKHQGKKKFPAYSSWRGFVHVYKLRRPMKYAYIEEDDRTPVDPPNTKTCGSIPCVHPQMVFHFACSKHSNKHSTRFVDLGTELTLPMNMVNKAHIQHVQTFELDIVDLMMNSGKNTDPENTPYNWTPEDAIVARRM